MPLITRDYHRQIISTMKDLSRHNKWWSSPVNLGGSGGTGGGSGIPIGGMHGQLIQSKVAYDTSELAYSGIVSSPPSGSLVDNLAHMRLTASGIESRVTVIESTSNLEIQEDDVHVASGVTVLNFEGPVGVVKEGTKTTVTVELGASGIAGAISGILDHGSLVGLEDNDHPHYLLHKNLVKTWPSSGVTLAQGIHSDPGANNFVVDLKSTFNGDATFNGFVNFEDDVDFAGNIEHASPTGQPAEFIDGVMTELRDDNVSNPPTQAEMVSSFGAAGREGFVGVLDDDGGDNDVYLVVDNGLSYWYVTLTKGA